MKEYMDSLNNKLEQIMNQGSTNGSSDNKNAKGSAGNEGYQSDTVAKDDLDSLLSRVEALENTTSNLSEAQKEMKQDLSKTNDKVNSNTDQIKVNTDDIEELKKKIKVLEDQLMNKVDNDKFNELFMMLNQFKDKSGFGDDKFIDHKEKDSKGDKDGSNENNEKYSKGSTSERLFNIENRLDKISQ